MKKYSLIAVLLIAVLMLVGCSHNAEVSINADESETVSFSAGNTENSNSKIVTEIENSTANSTTKTTDVQSTTKPKKTEKSTSANTTAAKSKVQTTTQRQTTTQKQTTTKKQTTTQKITTTEYGWNCKVDGHTSKEGQIGWVNSYDEAVKLARNYIDQNADSGRYRIEQCHMCGKYTAYITLDQN